MAKKLREGGRKERCYATENGAGNTGFKLKFPISGQEDIGHTHIGIYE